MLHTRTPWVLWQYIQTVFSFIMLKMKKKEEGRIFQLWLSSKCKQKNKHVWVILQNNTKKSIIGAWSTLIRYPHRSLNVRNSLIGDIGLAICQCQYIPKGEVWCIFWTIILKYELLNDTCSVEPCVLKCRLSLELLSKDRLLNIIIKIYMLFTRPEMILYH